MTVSAEDLRATRARIDRLEQKVESQQTKLGEVAEDTAWIKGFLQTNGNGRKPVRDVGLVAGGGGAAAGVLFMLEKIFGSGVVP